MPKYIKVKANEKQNTQKNIYRLNAELKEIDNLCA